MTSVGPGEVAWYLDDYLDEIMPCEATLEAWAVWLSKSDPTWPHEIPADGATFAASRLRFVEDIVATRHSGGEWTFSRPVDADANLVAVRFAPGTGWSPDNIIWGEDMEAALREWFAENADACDDEEHIAIGLREPKAVLVYKAEPPRLIVREAAEAQPDD